MDKSDPKVATGRRAKAVVLAGRKEKTSTNVKKDQLMKNPKGRVVSKRANAAGKEKFKHIANWNRAVQMARASMGLRGFCPVGGRTKLGRQLLTKTRVHYARLK